MPQLSGHTGQVGFVKSFPDFFQAVFWNTDSGILDRDKYFVVLLGCLNRDRGIRMTELDRIVDQIVKYLLDFAEISSDKQLLTGENQVEADMFVGADPHKRSQALSPLTSSDKQENPLPTSYDKKALPTHFVNLVYTL